MTHVDTLSRAPVHSIQMLSWPSSEIQEVQDLDDDLVAVKKWVTAEKPPQTSPENSSPVVKVLYKLFPSLVLENGAIYRK